MWLPQRLPNRYLVATISLMTTYWEEQQSLWYVSGPAEVLAGPGAMSGPRRRSFGSIAVAGPAGPAPCRLRPTLSVMRANGDWISGATLPFRMSATSRPQRNSLALWAS